MRFHRLLYLAVALVAASRAYAQAPYVDPALRGLSKQPHASTGVAMRRATAFDVQRVAVFAQIRGEQAIVELNAAGARIGTRIGRLLTAEIPVSKLEQLLSSPSFEMIEAAREVSVSHDSSMRAISADMVRRATGGTWTGNAGRGIIVGVYDTGLDFTHDDFLDANGQTRLLALWDQTGTGTPPTGFSYGRYCDRASVQAVVANPASTACPQVDTNGHGTHVMGTAAGDGSAVGTSNTAPFTFAGVAPLADLIVVKGGNGLFAESSIVDGLRWLEQQARAFNRPMVANVSIGGQAGPHDGTRLYEAMVDSLSRAGFIVVISAGNDGFNNTDRNPDGSEPNRSLNPLFHGTGPAGVSRDFTFEISAYTPLPGSCNDFVNISLWYEGSDRVSISMLRPDGGIVTAATGQLTEQNSGVGNVRIDNGSMGTNIRNNAYEAEIRVNDCSATGAHPSPGFWTLRVSPVSMPSGKPYHFWMASQSLGGGSLARGRQNFDNHYVVSSPGNARSAVTVGAFVTKNCWNSPAKPEGPVCFVTREPIGELARFSAGGPTRDGRMKPEITAPGMAITSARSRTSFPAANRLMADGVHSVNQGTSMAAPHVTGAIALMLENRPTLTHTDVKDIFSRSATRDAFTARVYDNSADAQPRFWWGYGKLNVCAAIGATGSTSTTATGPVVITPATDTIPINATTRFFGCSPSGGAITFRSSNPAVATIDNDGLVRTLQRGIALLIASSGAFADTAELIVTDPASLRIALRDLAPDTTTLSPRGTQLPLLSTVLRPNGYESIRVTQLSYRLTGIDPAARLVLISDANRNGVIDSGERIVGAKAVALNGTPLQVDVTLDSVTVSQRDSLQLIAAVELSGAAPNATSFTAELIPSGTRSIGMRSGVADRIEAITTPLASTAAVTSVLAAGQMFSLSENPVRSGRVVFNFSEAPRTAAIYTLTGRRVADLLQRATTNGSIAWNLTNDDGARVAAGVYIAVFDLGSITVREKVFVLSSSPVAQ